MQYFKKSKLFSSDVLSYIFFLFFFALVLIFKKYCIGISLVIQWLRLHTLNARGLGSIPGKENRSHMLQLRSGTAKLKKNTHTHTHTHIVLGIIFSIMKFHGYIVSSLIWCQSRCPTHLLPHSVEPAPCHPVDVLSVPSSFREQCTSIQC